MYKCVGLFHSFFALFFLLSKFFCFLERLVGFVTRFGAG